MSKPLRECIPSLERDAYVQYCRTLDYNEITVRQKNRYIDEFLRFCASNFRHSSAKKIMPNHICEFAKHLHNTATPISSKKWQQSKNTTYNHKTAKTKLVTVMTWCTWMFTNNMMPHNPAQGLSASALLRDAQMEEISK